MCLAFSDPLITDFLATPRLEEWGGRAKTHQRPVGKQRSGPALRRCEVLPGSHGAAGVSITVPLARLRSVPVGERDPVGKCAECGDLPRCPCASFLHSRAANLSVCPSDVRAPYMKPCAPHSGVLPGGQESAFKEPPGVPNSEWLRHHVNSGGSDSKAQGSPPSTPI